LAIVFGVFLVVVLGLATRDARFDVLAALAGEPGCFGGAGLGVSVVGFPVVFFGMSSAVVFVVVVDFVLYFDGLAVLVGEGSSNSETGSGASVFAAPVLEI
jgi:hypothetical protein